MVTLLGDGITVDELAHHFGTIGYEVLTSLGHRYARVYKGGNVVEPLAKPEPAQAAEQPPSPPPIEQPASPPPLPG
jgi:alanine racemase